MERWNRFAAFAVILVMYLLALACLSSETQVDTQQSQNPGGFTPIPAPDNGGGSSGAIINFIDPESGNRVSGFQISVTGAGGLATAFSPIVETRDASGNVTEVAVSSAVPSDATAAFCTVNPSGPRQITINATAAGDCEALVTMETGDRARLPGDILP